MLSDDDVLQITRLVESLDRSTFDFLQLELGELRLTIGKGSVPPGTGGPPGAPVTSPSVEPHPPPVVSAAPLTAGTSTTPAGSPGLPTQTEKKETVAQDETVEIAAPIMGRFYAKPSPSAPPFVSVGAKVDEDSTLALIEVMKVFNAVRSGVSGVVTEICVPDEQFVEYGQVLFRVKLAAPKKGT
jgi:acetyl-CoA carboxylase biotin carboxyl carrier protein